MLLEQTTSTEPLARRPALRPPRTLVETIERPQLVSAILAGLRAQVVTLMAPPGFGKTEAMRAAHAALGGGEGTGWLGLTTCHADLALFRADLAEALGLPRAAESLDALLAAVEARPTPTVLFLDCLEIAESGPLRTELAALVAHLPENLRIAIAGSDCEWLPLARLRARGLATRIGPDQLAFGRGEIRRLMARRHGVRVQPDALHEFTRGWPAMVQLSEGAVAEPRHPLNADLAAYVEEVVLPWLPPHLRSVATVAAVLDEFPPELGSALGGVEAAVDGSTWDRWRPVFEPCRDHAGWFRLHPVLRHHFEVALGRTGDDAVRDLHLRAADWYSGRGHLQKTVSHAARGGAWDVAAAAIQGAGGVNLFIRAGHSVLQRLVEDLPAPVIASSPRLSLCQALVLAKKGKLAASRELYEAIVAGSPGFAPEEPIPPVTLDHIGGLIDIYQDLSPDDREVEALERRAQLLPPSETWHRGWMFNHLCILQTRRGDLEDAHRSALQALECYREERTVYTQIFMLMHLGMVAMFRGSISAALAHCREAQELLQAAQWSDQSLAALAQVPLAEIVYDQGDVAQAERMLGACLPALAAGEGWVDIYARAFRVLASARLRLVGIDSAMAVLDAADQVALRRSLPRLKATADILRVALYTRAGMLESAEQVCATLSALLDARRAPAWRTWHEVDDLLLARAGLRLAQGQAVQALLDVESLLAHAESNGSGYHLLRGAILATRAGWAAGHHAYALDSLQTAIGLARPHELLQPFLDEEPAFSGTVRAIVRRFGLGAFTADAVQFVSRIAEHGLTSEVRRSVPSRSRPVTAGLFSRREQEVLDRLEAGLTNKEIARALDIAEPTVKYHLKNVFGKLGVSRRSLAVSTWRRLRKAGEAGPPSRRS